MTDGAARREAVGPDTTGAVGNAPPLFIRLERGVSGYELEDLGYKVTLLPKRSRAAKAKAAPTKRQRRLTKRDQRRRAKMRARVYRLKLIERHGGIEGRKAFWREQRRAQRAKKKALVDTPNHESPGTGGTPGTGPAPVTTSSGAE